jgi:N-acetyl-anhydromuramyl-L-alanine amidase AmpD
MTDNYAPAHWRPSPNFNSQARTIDMVIIHDTEGGYEQSINFLCQSTTTASAHYIFRSSDGDVSQMVHEADVAWHAGAWNYNVRSIGIEHEGFAAQPGQWYTDTMLAASAKLVADICRRYNIPIDRQHIIGHMEVLNPDGTLGGVDHHRDPGPGWPWDRYLHMVRDNLAGTVVVPDPDYAVYAAPTINLSIFRQVLQNAGSPAFDEVEDCYNTCTDNGVNPAVALAFFALESNYGTALGVAQRMNWGNLTDPASGQLATYDAWALGLRDWCNHFRQGVYANRGLKTISQIVPAYQPSSAGGTILGYNTYIRGLHDLIKRWADQLVASGNVFAPRGSLSFTAEPTTVTNASGSADSGPAPDYPTALWRPSPYFTPAERTINMVIIHNVEGEYQSALDWLCGARAPRVQSSMHYLLRSSDGDVTQMVQELDTAWHASNWEYNHCSVGVGHEGYAAQPDKWYTDVMLQSSARLVADICRRHKIPIDRQHIIGHNEVPDPHNAGQTGGSDHHPDPGPGWPWDRYIQMVKAAAATPAASDAASNTVLDRSSGATALSFGGAATDYPAAHWTANPNFGSRLGNKVNLVVIHDTEGLYQTSIDYLIQSGSSAHYIIRSSDGDITQQVREANAAWHAGNISYNRRSIGIEHEGYANAATRWYTDAMLTASAKLVADICRRYSIPIDRDHIIGHYQVPDPYHAGLFGGSDHHTDPGPGWPWDRYIQMVQSYSGQAPAPPPSGDGGGALIKPDPDYPVYAAPTISYSTFREVLANAGSPAFDEVDDCYNVSVQQGVNPAVALAFFALESNYGTTPGAVDRMNWGNLTDHASGQLKTYSSWNEGLTDWCYHFRTPAYANAQTISQIVPIYQPGSVPHTVAGYNDYITRLHDLVKGWSSADGNTGGSLAFGSGSGAMAQPRPSVAAAYPAATIRRFAPSAATIPPPTTFDFRGGAGSGQQRVADPNASDYPLLGPPSISFDEFAIVFLRHPESPLWQEASPSGQPWAEDLRPYWNKILSYHIDPLIALSFFAHESSLGRDAAIAPLHNWGNLKQGSQYRSFSSWMDGLDAWCRHVTGPLYVGAGNMTIAQIVPIYAPVFENPGYYADLLDNYIHPFLNEDPNPQFVLPAVLTSDPDYAIYANPTINLSIFRQVLRNAGSPALPEADVCYYVCTDNGVNPAVALAFFGLESNYGTAPGAVSRKNWGNLSAGGQLKSYTSWAAGLLDWCNHFRIPAYANAQTISKVVPIYQPSRAGGTVDGYNRYITLLHDLIKGWADQLAAQGNVFAPR